MYMMLYINIKYQNPHFLSIFLWSGDFQIEPSNWELFCLGSYISICWRFTEGCDILNVSPFWCFFSLLCFVCLLLFFLLQLCLLLFISEHFLSQIYFSWFYLFFLTNWGHCQCLFSKFSLCLSLLHDLHTFQVVQECAVQKRLGKYCMQQVTHEWKGP